MTAELTGKVAIVTGGARRIGYAISLRLAESGAAVVVNTKTNLQNAEKTVADIEAKGGAALACRADVTDPASVTAMVEETLQKFGRIDILVHNAVARNTSHLQNLTLEGWHEALSVILDGAFLCTQACAPHLTKNQGSIVYIGGMSAHIGSRHMSTVVGKAGLVGLTHAMAVEFAPDVVVNCVAPGHVDDHRFDRRVAHGSAQHAIRNTTPAGRGGTSEEVAEAVAMLCSPRCRYITGQVLHVNGGLYFGT